MKFAAPLWLYGLIALPLLYLFLLWDERRRQVSFTRFAQSPVWNAIAPEIDWKARSRKARLWCLAVGFAIVALARPQWGSHEEVVKVSGLDVLIVLDVSNSMETEDVVPNRLKESRHWIRTLVEQLAGDRVGVVAFAGSSYMACPLTTDLDYVVQTTAILGPKMIANQGTDIGVGLETARKALERGAEEITTPTGPNGTGSAELEGRPSGSRVVILISDGEDHEDGAFDEAQKLHEAGVKFYVVGVGTEKGGPIPVRDDNGALQGYKRDRHGQSVVSTFHPDELMKIAASAQGRYWNMSTAETEVTELLGDMGALNRSDYAERRYLVYEDRFQVPLALAVLFLFLEISTPARRVRREKGNSVRSPALTGAAAVTGLFCLLCLIFPELGFADGWFKKQPSVDVYLDNEKGLKAYDEGKTDEAKSAFGAAQALDPTRPELQYNQGVVQMKESDVDSAMEAFAGSARGAHEPKLAGQSLFNLGVAQSKKGDFQGAIGSYLGAIDSAKKVGDSALEHDARKNLELLAMQRQQQSQQGKDGDDKDQKKDDKDQKGNQDQDKKRYRDEPKNKKFKSQKLSPEDADRVMAELTNRERELQQKIKKQHANPQVVEKDW